MTTVDIIILYTFALLFVMLVVVALIGWYVIIKSLYTGKGMRRIDKRDKKDKKDNAQT